MEHSFASVVEVPAPRRAAVVSGQCGQIHPRWSEIEDELATTGAAHTRHERPPGRSFRLREHDVPMVGFTVEDAGLAGAAVALLAVGLDLHARVTDRLQQRRV